MGNAAIIEAVVERMNRLDDDEQREILDFVERIEQRTRDAENPLHLSEAQIHAMLHGPTRTVEESWAIFYEKYKPVDLSHLSEDEIQARLDAEVAAMSPEKVLKAKRAGLM